MSSNIHPVKVLNYCPKCGSDKFHPINNRAKQCDKCSFVYFFNASSAVTALIFNDDGKLLLTRRAIEPFTGMLDLPGGFVELNESAEDALCRELKEELGISVKNMEYFGSFPNEYPYSGISVFTLDITFKVQVDSLENMVAMDDISGFEFKFPHEVNIDELPSFSMRKIIQELTNKL